MTDYHPYSPTFCVSCGNPDGECTGVKASDIDLTRVVSDKALADIREVVGVTHEPGITVAELIRAEAGIGYGGHFAETSDDEDTVLAIAAVDDRELNGMHAARLEYTTAIRAAIGGVTVLLEALEDAIEYRQPQNSGCCPDHALCEDHASDQAKADTFVDLHTALQAARED